MIIEHFSSLSSQWEYNYDDFSHDRDHTQTCTHIPVFLIAFQLEWQRFLIICTLVSFSSLASFQWFFSQKNLVFTSPCLQRIQTSQLSPLFCFSDFQSYVNGRPEKPPCWAALTLESDFLMTERLSFRKFQFFHPWITLLRILSYFRDPFV